MTTDFYNPTGTPATGAAGQSSPIRAELALIQAGFAKLAALTSNGQRIVFVNSGESAYSTDSNFKYDGVNLTIYGRKAGYRGIPQRSVSTDTTTVADDAAGHLFHPDADTTARTWTIDSNANVPYDIGTAITFINGHGAGVITIAITADTLRMAGTGSTGSRSLAADGMATAVKVTATEWRISGIGLT